MSQYLPVIVILGGTILAVILGNFIARSIRMKDYSWKLGVILGVITLGTTMCIFGTPKLGIDLSGGTILIYEIDENLTAKTAAAKTAAAAAKTTPADGEGESDSAQAGPDTDIDMPSLIEALRRRIDPSGVREIVVRPYGPNQVEIIVPRASKAEIEALKTVITKTGYLKFRIVASPTRNPREYNLGQAALNSTDESVRMAKFIKNENDQVVAEWVAMAKDPSSTPENPVYKMSETELSHPMLIRELVPGQKEVLVVVDPDERLRVEGSHLSSVVGSYDQTMHPCVNFRMNSQGSKLFGLLTRRNLPDKEANSYAHLGIVMDDALLSAPRIQSTITSQGEITGNFTQPEVDELVRVLKAGRLPAVLKKQPISDYNISPLLGSDTIQKGKIAIVVSISAVLAFMLVYYRFAGIVACLALVVNLILIVALMIVIDAAFTLPGLAGLVLTVGMSVDANVLIFERIREELRRGTTLRMAIRNGFDRATTTIVDANITTLITAMVLYGIGTDQIRGFAITLILGILMSMFTAIFCSRVIFEISERRGWLKKLSMMQLISETDWNFLGLRKAAAAFSLIIILIGFGAVAMRGRSIFDIDFNGGTSVQAVLREPMPIQDVREKLASISGNVSVTEVNPTGQAASTVYKIDTDIEDENELEAKLSEVFQSDMGESLLVTHSMEFTAPTDISTAAANSRRQPPQIIDDLSPIKNSAMAGELVAWADTDASLLAQADPAGTNAPGPADNTATDVAETDSQEDFADDDLAGGDASPVAAEGTAAATEEDAAPPTKSAAGSTAEAADGEAPKETAKSAYRTASTLKFDEPINAETLKRVIRETALGANMEEPFVEMSNPLWDGTSAQPYDTWEVRFSTGTVETGQLLERLRTELSGTPAWLSSSKIGSAVAGQMKTKAIAAILVSLIGIVAYIWVRFQRVGFGLAAVLALVHDVCITLGAIAASVWLADYLGFLLIEEFKISLAVVAAFLTIVGYSLNDTIVVFDRIREVRGKSPELREDMINASINQTLSRTLLTSTTTLLVVVILYAIGGEGIHGFAFSLLVGVLVGTYSSVFIASPALLWMTKTTSSQGGSDTKKARAAAATSSTTS